MIVWIVGELSADATLTYDLIVPEADPPYSVTLLGAMVVNQQNYLINPTELKYRPENTRPLGSEWLTGTGADWLIVDGVLTCFAGTGQDPKHAWVNQEFGTGDYTVIADIRMVDWADGDLARAGLAVRVNPEDGERALNFLLHEDTFSVDFLNDLVSWGTYLDYAWQVGEWYTMQVVAQGSRLEGQIARRGSNEVPASSTWDDPWNEFRSPGYPGLTGSTMQGLTAQFDNFQVLVDGEVVFFDDFEESTPVGEWSVY
jgi:hypothetical protein